MSAFPCVYYAAEVLCLCEMCIRDRFPENWDEWYPKWTAGEVTASEAMRQMGIKKDSFYRLAKRYEENSSNLEDGGT